MKTPAQRKLMSLLRNTLLGLLSVGVFSSDATALAPCSSFYSDSFPESALSEMMSPSDWDFPLLRTVNRTRREEPTFLALPGPAIASETGTTITTIDRLTKCKRAMIFDASKELRPAADKRLALGKGLMKVPAKLLIPMFNYLLPRDVYNLQHVNRKLEATVTVHRLKWAYKTRKYLLFDTIKKINPRYREGFIWCPEITRYVPVSAFPTLRNDAEYIYDFKVREYVVSEWVDRRICYGTYDVEEEYLDGRDPRLPRIARKALSQQMSRDKAKRSA